MTGLIGALARVGVFIEVSSRPVVPTDNVGLVWPSLEQERIIFLISRFG